MYTHILVPLPARFALFVAMLLMPATAMAAAPEPVIGIRAWEQDGKVHVGWGKLPDSDRIAYYRIFFSSKSILGNSGLYDDFDIADAQMSEHVLANAPQSPELFFSVLAVNDQGEESPFFAEEASLKRDGGPPSQASSAAMSSAMSSSQAMSASSSNQLPANEQPVIDALTILSAEPKSSTGILVTFSLPIMIPADQARDAFEIRDSSGETLPITRLVVTGNTVMIHTVPQEQMKVYQLRAQGMQGQKSDGTSIALDPMQNSILFVGYSGPGAMEPMQPMPAGTSTIMVRLRAEADARGWYTVDASWEGSSDGIMQWKVAQTIDHGFTFSPDQTLPGTALGVRIPGVPMGELGIRVQAVAEDGRVLGSGLSFIRLGTGPSLPAQVSWPQQPIIQKPVRTDLPQSGIGAWAAMSLIGAACGTAVMRRKRFV